MDFDVAVIGGGPGGYVCAVRAAQLGLKTVVVEEVGLGGTCLHRGCIPTKSLLQTAHVKRIIECADEFGIETQYKTTDIRKVVERSEKVIAMLNRGVDGLLASASVTKIDGHAEFLDKTTISISCKDGSTQSVTASNIVIATGAVPRSIGGLESLVTKNLVWTSKEALKPDTIPQALLILGSGAIGIELASFYNAMGSEVTVVEIQDRILTQEDADISEEARKAFSKQGIKIMTGTNASMFVEEAGRVSAELRNSGETIAKCAVFDKVIVAIGVVPNTQNLGLDRIGVKTKPNGAIEVFDHQETSVKNIFAIGDVTEAPWLAHKASREGIIAAEKIANLQVITPINLQAIPSCIYSYPQIASIGMTEEMAREVCKNIRVGRSYFRANGRALTAGEPDGFVKVIFESATGELLGAHMVGAEVTELLPIFSLAIASELTEKEILTTVFPHPTLSECLQEAVISCS
ncbi:MAG: dihydrolipoyl dehydrogenase [Holosporales bacterium]|nr:dihydrolipoyl dehydrogenase [Holosporales bacterium]